MGFDYARGQWPLGMIRPMGIYTRGGDDGSTGLYGGPRLSKSALRVEAYGQVDELNAVLGWVRAASIADAADRVLGEAQHASFRLGAWLASAPGKDPGVEPVGDREVEAFEAAIDAMEVELDPLKQFILPGGSEAGARLHMARVVCRRAERTLVALAAIEEVDPAAVRWLNRLSDLLFVQARWVNHEAGVADTPWVPKRD